MLLLSLVLGCTFDEELPQANISGTVVIPREAATRRILDAETGEITEVTDSRFIGPVYLGAFPSVNQLDYGYTHPETGPVVSADLPGNTYPYGGGSVGRFDFACFDYLACRTPSGRFTDYDDLISFFRDVVGDPIQDQFGNEVDSAGYFQTVCYDLFEITADYEMEWISEVTYEGEKIDRLDFVENADGDFEAEFNMWRVNYRQGMQLWGWMDAPSDMFEGTASNRFTFSTCDPNDGQTNTEYNNDIAYGVAETDLLNYPARYIGEGDWVVGMDDVFTVEAEDAEAYRADTPEIRLVIGEKVEN
ncbi:MAG: hypothetical protein VX899_27130 [Myxococcota bacterium]|nr:hypothetical protein [Myxococcota bacterium]